MDPRYRARTTARSAAALLLAAVLLAGCGGADQDGSDPGTGTPAASSPEPPAAPGGEGEEAGGELVAGTLSGTDLAWLQLMAPMNDRTLLLLELVREHGGDQGLTGFAERLDATHRAELARMRALLDEAGVPDTNPHEGHDMTGMVTDEELREVRESGEDFDAAALAHLREHLEQAEMLSGSAREAGSDADTVALAEELAELRGEQLAELELLEGPGGTG